MAKNMSELQNNKVTNNLKEEFELVSVVIDNAECICKIALESRSALPVRHHIIPKYGEVVITAHSVIKDVRGVSVAIYDKRIKEAAFEVELVGASVHFNSNITYVPEAKKVYEEVAKIIKELCDD